MKDFKNKVAVVTGAASGIGRGMAETFVAAGMRIVLADIEQAALEETTRSLLATGADVHPVVTDVSKADQVDDLARRTLDKYGAVHVLCNNVGVSVRSGPSWESSLDDWQWILGVNLMGVVHGIRSFLPIMIKRDTKAHIVNTASMAGLIANTALYGTTKFAVVGLSEALYLELQPGRFKPRMSVLCPGFVDTNIILRFTFDAPGEPNVTDLEGICGGGDSGGPAYIKKGNVLYVIGVSSGQDARPANRQVGHYGVFEYYTRVSHFTKWIHDVIGN